MKTLSMALAGAALAEETEHDLLAHLQAERGVASARHCEAQVRLARWMLGDDSTKAGIPVSRLLGAFDDELLIRFLTGEVEPEPSAINFIAEQTGGAVLPSHWNRKAEMPVATPPSAAGKTAGATFPQRRPSHVYVGDDIDLIRRPDGGVSFVQHDNIVRVPVEHLAAVISFAGPTGGVAA